MITHSPAEKWLRGPVGFALISLLHLAAIYVIATGLGRISTIELPRSKVIFVDNKDPPLIPPPPPGPTIEHGDKPQIDKLIPPETIDYPDDEPAEVITTTGLNPQTGDAVITPKLIAARVDPRHPLTQPDYPAGEIRQEHEGRVLLRLRIGPDGRVLAAEVVTSSGFPALDRAAVQTALREWRLMPARQGDATVEGTFSTWVRFDLTDR
jgi:protein TonB